jgi:acetyltransferase-like isoleucine patch superfamily enzyme
MRLLGLMRVATTRVRLVTWVALARLRLRTRGCKSSVRLGSGVRCRSLPKIQLVGTTGGRVDIRIGDGVDLGRMLLIDIDASATSMCTIGAGTRCEFAIRLQLLGGELTVGESCELRDGAVLKCSMDGARLAIGEHVKIGRNVALHCRESVTVADFVTLADRATVVDSFHDVDGSSTWTMLQPVRTEPIVIERNAIIYSGAVITHGTTIGENTVVAANALVPAGSHPSNTVMVGNPARRVRDLNHTGRGT